MHMIEKSQIYLHIKKSLILICLPLIEAYLLSLQVDSGEASALYPRCLGVYGNWLAETRSESPKVIMKEYLVEVS